MEQENMPAEGSADSSAIVEDTKETTYTQAEVDAMISKGISKYEATNFQKKVDMGITAGLEKAKTKTPEQVLQERLDTIEEERRVEKLEIIHQSNLSKAKDILSERNLPVELADLVATHDMEKTQAGLDNLSAILSGLVTKTKQGVVDSSNPIPPSKTANSTTGEPGADASKEAWVTWIKNNKKLV